MGGWARTGWLLAAGAGACWLGCQLVRQRRYLDLTGKSVLITGGSRGLGLVLARQFVSRGASVAICARDADELERARVDLEARGGLVLTVVCDLANRNETIDMVWQVKSAFGRIDVLVNNAGVIQVGPMEVMTLADYEEAMKVHYRAPLQATLEVLPEMRARHSGRIVNISSIGGKVSVPHLLPYCASKFALVGFSEGLRSELIKEGIYVTTVVPGLMRTGSPRNATFKGQHHAEYAWFSISDAMPLLSMSASAPRGRLSPHASTAMPKSCSRCRQSSRWRFMGYSPA